MPKRKFDELDIVASYYSNSLLAFSKCFFDLLKEYKKQNKEQSLEDFVCFVEQSIQCSVIGYDKDNNLVL